MKIFFLSLLIGLFSSFSWGTEQCCKMIALDHVIQALGGHGSAEVRRHQNICEKLSEQRKQYGTIHGCAWLPGPGSELKRSQCRSKMDEASCTNDNYCKWKLNSVTKKFNCEPDYTKFEQFCGISNQCDVARTNGCCGISENFKNDSNAKNIFNGCQNHKDSIACEKARHPVKGSYCQWNDNNICPKPRVLGQGCCGVSQQAIASTKKFYPDKANTQINTMLNACQNYDKQPQYCEGDCQWYTDNNKCKPLPEPIDNKGCCGISQNYLQTNPKYSDRLTVFNMCENKQAGACNETGRCQWHKDLNKCKKPEKPMVIGCCGVKKKLRASSSLIRLINVCNNNNNPGACTNDYRAKRVCDWFQNPNDCKIQQPNNRGPKVNVNNPIGLGQKKKGKAIITATVRCPQSCTAKANKNCPQKCEIECSPSRFLRNKAFNKLKTTKIQTIQSGSCEDLARRNSKRKSCRAVSCSPATAN